MRGVPMYDLYSKGNYVGSFRTKKEAESFILDISRNDSEERFARMKWTTIRSTHYEMT